MPTTVVLIILSASIGSGALVAIAMWFYFRMKRLEATGGADLKDLDRLAEQVAALRDQLLATREEMGELHERVDFAERMLARGQPERLELPKPPDR